MYVTLNQRMNNKRPKLISHVTFRPNSPPYYNDYNKEVLHKWLYL